MQVTEDGGKTFQQGRRDLQARRQPRPVDRPRRHRSPDSRVRRRPLRVVRSRRHLGVVREPPAGAVLQGGARRRPAVLQRVRRHAGQQHGRRPVAARRTVHGIVNADWYITTGGDGFQTVVDPKDPNIVYSESQHGVSGPLRPADGRADRHPAAARRGRARAALELGLAADHQPACAHAALLRGAARLPQRRPRRHLAAGERRSHAPDRPQQAQGDGARLQRRRRREERLDVVLRQHRRPVREPEEGRASRRGHRRRPDPDQRGRRLGAGARSATFPGVPDESYVSRVVFSRHDAATMYATFDNHKKGDFKPYVLVSTDTGRTWTSIAGNLPERGTVYALRRGSRRRPTCSSPGPSSASSSRRTAAPRWNQLKGGLPDDPGARPGDPGARERSRARDVRPRLLHPGRLSTRCALASKRDARQGGDAVPGDETPGCSSRPRPNGGREKAFFGDRFFTAPNPPFGAVFTYYLKDEIKTLRKTRLDAEKEKAEEGRGHPVSVVGRAPRRGSRGRRPRSSSPSPTRTATSCAA